MQTYYEPEIPRNSIQDLTIGAASCTNSMQSLGINRDSQGVSGINYINKQRRSLNCLRKVKLVRKSLAPDLSVYKSAKPATKLRHNPNEIISLRIPVKQIVD